MKLEEELLEVCQKKSLTIGLAESCTGGACAARLTSVSGASNYFMGSIVSYNDLVKSRLLNVPEIMLKEQGAVSQEVALKMVEGALKQLLCDCAVAFTGFAGPLGGTDEVPVGTVYIAVGGKGHESQVNRYFLQGNRRQIIEKSVDLGIKALIDYIALLY